MSPSAAQVLLVHADDESAETVSAMISPYVQITRARTREEARKITRRSRFTNLIAAWSLPDGNALPLIRKFERPPRASFYALKVEVLILASLEDDARRLNNRLFLRALLLREPIEPKTMTMFARVIRRQHLAALAMVEEHGTRIDDVVNRWRSRYELGPRASFILSLAARDLPYQYAPRYTELRDEFEAAARKLISALGVLEFTDVIDKLHAEIFLDS